MQTSAQAFAKISPLPSNRLEIPSRTRLGRYYRVSPKQLYYDQAATLCRYLYEAEDGKRRRQLLDYVIAYYTGNQDGLDFAPAFGAPAAELGKLAVAHGKEIERRQ